MSVLQRAYGATLCRLCAASDQQRPIAPEAMFGSGQWLIRCGNCAGVYLYPDLPAAALDTFYRIHYRRLFPFLASSHPDERLLFQMRSREFGWIRAHALAPAIPQGARVLELGSGHGAFLGRLHARRPDLQLVAIEADNGERELAIDDAPVKFISLQELENEQSFDLIVLFHVLEHLEDPVGLLRRLVKLATPNARLVIEVPDAFYPGSTWSEVHPAHTSYFTARALTRAVLNGYWQPEATASLHDGALSIVAYPATAAPGMQMASPEEISTLDALLHEACDRPVKKIRKCLMNLVARMAGIDSLGRLSRWKNSLALDASLSLLARRRMCMGTPVDVISLSETVELAVDAMVRKVPLRMADINTSKLMEARDNPAFRSVLMDADLCVADGMGVVWAARSLGVALPERVTGIDTMTRVISACADLHLRPFLLGAKADVLEAVAAELCTRHPGLILAGTHHGYFSRAEEDRIVELIRASAADCLIVALPSPHQDLLMARIHYQTGVSFAMGVGGAFDVIAGRHHRAPVLMQKAGMEWLFRFIQEPRRLAWRYLASNTRLLVSAWLPAMVAKVLFHRV